MKDMSPVTAAVREAPVKRKTRTPEEILKELEAKVIKYGISNKEFYKIRTIGQCPNQVQDRIKALRNWLTEHHC